MVDAITSTCDQHPDRFDCPDALLDYNPRFREYGLIVHDGDAAVVVIDYCPWCGAKLPVSLRDEWFDQLDQLGLEPDSPFIPAAMRSGEWWAKTS
jgi:hypothetical protein